VLDIADASVGEILGDLALAPESSLALTNLIIKGIRDWAHT
jgi:hypothetical protein